MTKTVTTTAAAADTNTQQRAICAACFAQQAVRASGKLVPHGYTRPQQWHQNVGTCAGAGHQHFGTEAGRDYTASIAERLRASATHTDANAAGVLAGTDAVLTRERIKGTRVYSLVAMQNPTEYDRKHYAASLASQAKSMRAQAAELDAAVASWKPAKPVVVAVEKKQTLLHWRGGYWRGRACAASAMAAQTGYTTTEIADVTCERCRARHAMIEAKRKAICARCGENAPIGQPHACAAAK